MNPFTEHTGRALPLDRSDVDTDQIVPARYLRRIERSGAAVGVGRHARSGGEAQRRGRDRPRRNAARFGRRSACPTRVAKIQIEDCFSYYEIFFVTFFILALTIPA